MKRWIATAFSGFLFLGSLKLAAQENLQQHLNDRTESNIADLDPVTITASLTPEKISKTGRNLLIIKGERFYDLPVNSVDELLRYLPGVEVQARGPMGSQSDFVLRGGTFQQVLVILDGVRLNDPNSGHFTSYIPIAPAEIDRIEVLKGASSAIYGSEAVGGVINIITKTFASHQGIKKSNAVAQITGGEYGLLNANAGGFISNGKTSVGLGILTNNADGQQQRGTKGFFHNNTASVSVSHFFDEHWQLALRTSYDDRKFAAQNFYTSFTSDTADERVKTLWNQLQLTYHSEKDIIHLSAGYKKLDDRYAFNSASAANQSRSNLLQASITDEKKLHSKTTLVSGLQFIDKKISSNDRGKHNVKQAAAFAIVNQQLGESFLVAPAARMEWNEKSGWEFVPQINLSYRGNKFQLRGSAGKTIRDADFTERFNNYNKALVTSGRLGNPDLEPERSLSYEAGADVFIATSLKLSATFFQRYHTDLIDYVTTPYNQIPHNGNLIPTGSYALAKNISKVTTTGTEADIQYTKNFSEKQQFWVTIGFVWLNSKSSDATPSLYISSHAKYLANFSVEYRNQWFCVSVNGLYKDRQAQLSSANIAKVSKDYFVLNAKAEGVVIKNSLSVFAEADNLFDKNYADLLGAQMPGRWLMGGIKISLSK
ncbi:MAG: TonB-dependent receptor plug domain-containing protein [Flavisolibacter sp.]|jgi:iron complex outermembrane receptor protein